MQPPLGDRMRLNGAVMQNVADSDAARSERSRHQKATMAIERLTLGAHQANAMLRHIVLQTVETGLERGRSRHRLIIGDAVTIEIGIARPAAEGFTMAKIGDTAGS